MKKVGYYHVFPFQEIEQGASVVIWGMGEVGQHYLKQVLQTGYCNIEYAIDKNWQKHKDSIIRVLPPYAARRIPEGARIVIANGNDKIAGEIRQQLRDWGIAEERIVWNDIIVGESMVVSERTTQQAPKAKRIGFYHIFPFHLIKKGETVLLWGMGEVGRHYALQLQKTGYAQVEYAVDSNWKSMKDAPVEVKAPEYIAKSKDIKVVIANGSGSTAEAIRAKLGEMGVENNRILWEDIIVEGELVVQEAVQPHKKGRPYLYGSESEISNRRLSIHAAIDLLEDHDVVSFGIFHSCVLPMFDKMSRTSFFEILASRMGCPDFTRIRLAAEAEMRKCSQSPEITLEEIYEIVGRELGIEPQQGCEMEVKAIIEFSRGNPWMKEVYDMVLAAGKTIIFTEDTYLKKEYLQRIIESCGYREFQQIFSSCDVNVKKESGDMYRLIRNMLGKELRYVHVGQNASIDKDKAEQCGIDGKYYYGVHEKGNMYRCCGLSELVGSAYRQLVNCKLHEDDNVYSVPYEYGFIYGGLLTLGFMKWVSQNTTTHGISKVIYLSSDSDVFKQVFCILDKNSDVRKIEWSDEVGARLCARFDRHSFLEKMLRNVRWDEHDFTIREYFTCLHIETLLNRIPTVRLNEFAVINSNNVDLIEKFLIENWDDLINCYEKEERIAKEYIRSIIGDSKKIAIVDVTSYGDNAKQLEKLINEWKIGCDINVLTIGTKRMCTPYIVGNSRERMAAYVFSRNYRQEILHKHLLSNLSCDYKNNYAILFGSHVPKLVGFAESAGELKFEYGINLVENRDMKTEIYYGVLDFCREYINWFGRCEELMNIPSYDAYIPFDAVAADKQYFEINLSRYKKHMII